MKKINGFLIITFGFGGSLSFINLLINLIQLNLRGSFNSFAFLSMSILIIILIKENDYLEIKCENKRVPVIKRDKEDE